MFLVEAFFVYDDITTVDGKQDGAGLVGHAVPFRPAVLDHQFAETVLVEFADIVIFGIQDQVSLRVNQALAAINLHDSESVDEAFGVIVNRVYHPGLCALVLIAVFLRGLILDRFEVLRCRRQGHPRRYDAQYDIFPIHNAKLAKNMQLYPARRSPIRSGMTGLPCEGKANSHHSCRQRALRVEPSKARKRRSLVTAGRACPEATGTGS